MPRRFAQIELLPETPPFTPAAMHALGLRGIHCGSGRQLRPGWLNTDRLHFRDPEENAVERGRIARIEGDLYYLEHDSREPYPFEDASFEWAYSEHFIEHIALEEAITWLAEIRRLLKPGGRLRLSTPDLRRYIEGYLDPDNGFFAEHRERIAGLRAFAGEGVPERPAWMLNQLFYGWGHNWVFDLEEVRFAAGRAGFDPGGVVQWRFNEGSDPELAAMDLAWRSDESLYVELTAT